METFLRLGKYFTRDIKGASSAKRISFCVKLDTEQTIPGSVTLIRNLMKHSFISCKILRFAVILLLYSYRKKRLTPVELIYRYKSRNNFFIKHLSKECYPASRNCNTLLISCKT